MSLAEHCLKKLLIGGIMKKTDLQNIINRLITEENIIEECLDKHIQYKEFIEKIAYMTVEELTEEAEGIIREALYMT